MDKRGLLARSELLAALGEDAVGVLADASREVLLGRGEVVFDQDDPGRELYMVASGRIAIAKRSFNADTESIRALSWMGMQTLSFYYDTDESREGVRAFMEKRKPEFRKHMR